jgi:hypothetical protein
VRRGESSKLQQDKGFDATAEGHAMGEANALEVENVGFIPFEKARFGEFML